VEWVQLHQDTVQWWAVGSATSISIKGCGFSFCRLWWWWTLCCVTTRIVRNIGVPIESLRQEMCYLSTVPLFGSGRWIAREEKYDRSDGKCVTWVWWEDRWHTANKEILVNVLKNRFSGEEGSWKYCLGTFKGNSYRCTEGGESSVKTIGKSSEEIHMWRGTGNGKLWKFRIDFSEGWETKVEQSIGECLKGLLGNGEESRLDHLRENMLSDFRFHTLISP
jgi:hypothetical protein